MLLELAGVAGVLVGLAWPPIGIAAAIGLALLSIGAIAFHIRASDQRRRHGPRRDRVALAAATAVLHTPSEVAAVTPALKGALDNLTFVVNCQRSALRCTMAARAHSVDPRAERVRTRLREAAFALAHERPVDQMTVGDIVARAAVSRQVFYQHFTRPRRRRRDGLHGRVRRRDGRPPSVTTPARESCGCSISPPSTGPCTATSCRAR